MSLLPDALRCVQRGWHVFPVQPMGKTPHLIYPDKPYTIKWSEKATNDIQTAIRYWQWSPSANIGIACSPSRLFVVDCDMPKREYQLRDTAFDYLHKTLGPLVDGTDVFKALCEKLGGNWNDWNNTYRVCTGSMGCHYYYQWPHDVKASQASIVKGIVDVRGNGGEHGGYVLGAKSTTDRGSYVAENALPVMPAPRALVEYCTDGARSLLSPALAQFVRPAGSGSIAGLEATVLNAPDGNLNNSLLWAARAACHDQIPEQEAIETLGSAYVICNGRGGFRQAEQTIRSAYRLQRGKDGS